MIFTCIKRALTLCKLSIRCIPIPVRGLTWLLSSEQGVQYLKNMLQDTGPVGIKFGQYLYHRPDIVSAPWRNHLKSMLDNNEPVDVSMLHITPSLDVDPAPIGIGSLAQVHQATFESQSVVVKVLTPDAAYVHIDMWVCHVLVSFLQWCGYFPVDWDAFARDMQRQVDLRCEAEDMEYTQCLLKNSYLHKHVRVPRIYAVSKSMLVMEKVNGRPLHHHSIPKAVHETRIHVLCYMATHGDKRFHADLHDGNVLYNKDTGEVWLIDFGICAHPNPGWIFPLPVLANKNSPTYYQDVLHVLCGPGRDYRHLAEQLKSQVVNGSGSIGGMMCTFFRFLRTHQLTLTGSNISCFSQLVSLETTVPDFMTLIATQQVTGAVDGVASERTVLDLRSGLFA